MSNKSTADDGDKCQEALNQSFGTSRQKFDLESAGGIRHHFRHYPKETQDRAIEYLLAPFQKGRTRENLTFLIKAILEHYSPASDIIVDNKKVDFTSLGEDSEVIADFGMDSLSLMEISFFIEEVFDLRIENEKILSIVTLGDVIDMVERTQDEQDGVEREEVTFAELGAADGGSRAHKKYKVGWVVNPENPTAFLECNAPVINIEDLAAIKKLKKIKDKK
jgi:acyl carrier protein